MGPIASRYSGGMTAPPPPAAGGPSLVAKHALLLGVHPVQLVHVLAGDHLGPALLVHVVDPDHASGRAVTVSRVVDRTAPELHGLLQGQVVPVAAVEDTVGEGRARADGEALALEALSLVVHHVERGALLVPACNHGPARQSLTAVLEEDVGEQLRGRSDGDALLGPKLVQAAEPGQVALPERAVR